jgi:hypothetical protein
MKLYIIHITGNTMLKMEILYNRQTNELCTAEESLHVENSDVCTHNLCNKKKQSVQYFLKKYIYIYIYIYIVSVMYILMSPCTVLVSVTQ